MLLRRDDTGTEVGDLQKTLYENGYTKVLKTHIFDDATEDAIKTLQKRHRLVVDGIYGPKTAAVLFGKNASKLLKQSDLQAAAESLELPISVIHAVNEVESKGRGFLENGNPIILFERHIFYRLLAEKKYDVIELSKSYPGIVNKTPGGYAGGRLEYTRLAVADTINNEAALESCSWGLFQIMGFHWKDLGYESIHHFVLEQSKNEAAQLDAFVRFIKNDKKLYAAMKAQKWSEVARIYNGPNYRRNFYDVKLERAFERYATNNT
ncbi:N-acetylmuramidase family protein [Pelistega sp. MC2]|uniref:N-acetylmuramidase domain-containing protein n=1 Tax=Pelistega sp. MC2 TaxID=1720297 RepID=UPI0008D9C082|nr:N-acetylmuramidase family protein [Pelistega sp. MC2]